MLPRNLSTNLHLSVALPVPHALLPSIPEVLRLLVPSVTSAIGCPILVHPTFNQGPAIVSHAADLAIGGLNAIKSPVLFLKVFQVTDVKTVKKKKQSKSEFSFLTSPCDFVEDLSEDSSQESKGFELEFEIPVVSAPVVQLISVKK